MKIIANFQFVCSLHFFMFISNRLRRQKHYCGNYYSYDQCVYVGAKTTTFSLATIDNNILITSVTVGVLVPVLMIIVILVAFVTFVLVIRNGKIQ